MIKKLYHVGYGVRDIRKSIEFYQEHLNFGDLRLDYVDVFEGSFGDFVGGEKCHWTMMPHNISTVDFESVQILSRAPVPIPSWYEWGDIGFNEVCLEAVGLHELYQNFKNRSVKVLNPPQKVVINDNWSKEFFYIEDPDGITIKLEQDLNQSELTPQVNGYRYLCFGVSDMELSLDFYKNYLGHNQILWEIEGHLDWMDTVAGTKVEGRTVMLGNDYDNYQIQLVNIQNRKARKLFEGKRWGDIGLMEICYSVENYSDLEKFCDKLRKKNIKVLSEPQQVNADLSHAFIAYVPDPDGNYVEFSYHAPKKNEKYSVESSIKK